MNTEKAGEQTQERTGEEKLYWKLMFANLHYNGDSAEAMKRCSELLDEAMKSETLSDSFKKEYLYLFKDQASKLYEVHEMKAKRLKEMWEDALNKQQLVA